MGIFIYTEISKSVTLDAWADAYEESLQLAQKLNLCDSGKKTIQGTEIYCLEKVEEKNLCHNGIPYNKYWCAVGDYRTLRYAEGQSIRRNLFEKNEYNPNAVDPLLSVAAFQCHLNDKLCKKVENDTCSIFSNKTQGEPYHLSILAIACLLEARLPDKVFTFGDITKGQVQKAVRIANQYVSPHIDLPNCCDPEKFFVRVNNLQVSNIDKLNIYHYFYLGDQDRVWYNNVKNKFDIETINTFLEMQFKDSYFRTISMNDCLKLYFSLYDNLDVLCKIINFDSETHEQQVKKCKDLIKDIMNTKIYIDSKDCTDILNIDQKEERPYTTGTLFAQFFFAGAKNKKIDLYIPLEDLIKQLCVGLQKYWKQDEIEAYINELIKEENDVKNANAQDPSEIFKNHIGKMRKTFQENFEKYDISDTSLLLYYETGNSIQENIKTFLKKVFLFCQQSKTENLYHKLLQDSEQHRREFLAKHCRLFLRDCDWEKIFNDIQINKSKFYRYFSLFSIELSSENIINTVKAFTINDDLWEYAEKETVGLKYEDLTSNDEQKK